MTAIEKQIIETWQIHNRVNIFMINRIPNDALKTTMSTRGGRDIARQFAHMHNVRVWRLKSFAKKRGLKLTEFDKNDSPVRKILLKAYEQSGKAMEEYLKHCIENKGTVSNFKRGVVPMLAYYIAHEKHHHGNMLLTMKQKGFKLPDELKWGIWEWNKI